MFYKQTDLLEKSKKQLRAKDPVLPNLIQTQKKKLDPDPLSI